LTHFLSRLAGGLVREDGFLSVVAHSFAKSLFSRTVARSRSIPAAAYVPSFTRPTFNLAGQNFLHTSLYTLMWPRSELAMKSLIACLAISLIALPAFSKPSCSNGMCEVPNPSTTEVQLLEREKEGAWKAIQWQPSAAAAISAASTSGKPILVVLSVGQRGRADAADT
jgi:hypothetical protein